MNTVNFTTAPKDRPIAANATWMFPNTCRAWTVKLPLPTSSPEASTGTCPDR